MKFSIISSVVFAPLALAAAPVSTVTCNAQTYTYNELAGFGSVPSNARDKYGDTVSLGSSIAFSKWDKHGERYVGTLYALPDRGWNTNGTTNYQPRVHTYTVTFFPTETATIANPSGPNVRFEYKDTILLKGPDGTTAATGLDPDQTGGLTFPGFPTLPTATYTGDGFGGAGPGGKGISIDAEGIFLGESSDTFWISDEYGPYIYQFDKKGVMTAAIAPPNAFLPLRQGVVSFASDNPPIYAPSKHPSPSSPTQGRQNNQGLEGLTVSPDGKTMYALMQSALRQEGGLGGSSPSRRNARLLKYDISGLNKRALKGPRATKVAAVPVLLAEYVVPLPTFVTAAGATRVAAQSEMHYVSDTQLLILPRDSSVGRGYADPTSVYRHIDVIDISAATNINTDTYNAFNTSIADANGVLKAGITPATLCPWLDFNINSQLKRFGVHNGAPQDAGLLNEKWESIALLPLSGNFDRPDHDDEYYLFTLSDNDFITQDGYINFGKTQYKDTSSTVVAGLNQDNQALVFKVTLPANSKPLVG